MARAPRCCWGETSGANLERTAARVPKSDALVSCHQGAGFSWAELNSAVEGLACGLLGLGLAKGDRLGVWSPNRYEWTLIQYATAKLGVILVNINPAYRTSELGYSLRQSGCRVLAAAPEFKGADYGAMVEEARDGLPALEQVVFFDSPEWDALAAGDRGPGEAKLRARMRELDFDDPINIQYTSGTTGSPKGATLTHHNILNNALLVSDLLGYTEADRVCIPVPLYHCFGMVLGNLACSLRGGAHIGGRVRPSGDAKGRGDRALHEPLRGPDDVHRRTRPHASRNSISRVCAPGSWGARPAQPKSAPGSEMGIEEMTIAFGMTETSPASTMVRRDDTLEHRCGTVGEAMPHTEIKIVDPGSGRTSPAASQASSAPAATWSCPATGRTRSGRRRPSTRRA
jgi:fatty-acyl-CoA synthase